MNKYIFDLDDWSDGRDICMPTLLGLKNRLPNLKVTLFTIPDKMNSELYEEIKRFNWIQLAMHGLKHDTNFEFSGLDKEEAKMFISCGYNDNLVKGFKAPGWQISVGTMEALKELGFWVAVQYSDGRLDRDINGPYQPKVIEGLKYYAFKEYPHSFHGHTWNCCGNGLSEIFEEIVKIPKDSEFIFIDDYINEKN